MVTGNSRQQVTNRAPLVGRIQPMFCPVTYSVAGLFFGSSRNPEKHRNKNADLIDDIRASKHI